MEVDYIRDSQAGQLNCCDRDSVTLSHSSLVRNSRAALMLVDWIIDLSSVGQQKHLSEAVCQLCLASSWNAMQCSKAGMITSVVRCLQQPASASLDVSVVGE